MAIDSILSYLGTLLWSGWTSVLDYMAAHVLLCLVPAFVVAGYMSAMIPKEAITKFLGPRAPKWVSYPAASFGGFILAVCSCTILPLFAGIWKRGAGLGPAITFLFVGPAINILAISYTGAAIGFDIALARLVLSLTFGVGIGLIMAWVYRKEEAKRATEMANQGLFEAQVKVKPAVWAIFALLLSTLIVGTLQVSLLTQTYLLVNLPVDLPVSLSSALETLHLTLQGALLIVMLIVIGILAFIGMERKKVNTNSWSYAAIALAAATVLLAAPAFSSGSIVIGLNGRFFGEVILLAAIVVVAAKNFTKDELTGWLWETWKFIKQIFPLLIVGVFVAGMVKEIIPGTLVQSVAGQNTLLANFVAVLFGVFMYFPTLVEVPIAKMFLDLGMARGPLLAYLLADPELSVQSILVVGKIMGKQKTALYVSLVAIFSTLAGYLFGIFLTLV
jgi:uncharacterized protein